VLYQPTPADPLQLVLGEAWRDQGYVYFVDW